MWPRPAAGCPIIVRLASQTPFSAFELAVLAERAGVPEGVFSVITGEPSVQGPVPTGHPAIRKISFTASTEVGKRLTAESAGTVKKPSLELGGSAPFLVFDETEIEAAIEGALVSRFRNSGRTCVRTNGLLVPAGVYDEFASHLAKTASELRVGDGPKEDVEQGR